MPTLNYKHAVLASAPFMLLLPLLLYWWDGQRVHLLTVAWWPMAAVLGALLDHYLLRRQLQKLRRLEEAHHVPEQHLTEVPEAWHQALGRTVREASPSAWRSALWQALVSEVVVLGALWWIVPADYVPRVAFVVFMALGFPVTLLSSLAETAHKN